MAASSVSASIEQALNIGTDALVQVNKQGLIRDLRMKCADKANPSGAELISGVTKSIKEYFNGGGCVYLWSRESWGTFFGTFLTAAQRAANPEATKAALMEFADIAQPISMPTLAGLRSEFARKFRNCLKPDDFGVEAAAALGHLACRPQDVPEDGVRGVLFPSALVVVKEVLRLSGYPFSALLCAYGLHVLEWSMRKLHAPSGSGHGFPNFMFLYLKRLIEAEPQCGDEVGVKLVFQVTQQEKDQVRVVHKEKTIRQKRAFVLVATQDEDPLANPLIGTQIGQMSSLELANAYLGVDAAVVAPAPAPADEYDDDAGVGMQVQEVIQAAAEVEVPGPKRQRGVKFSQKPPRQLGERRRR